MSANATALVSVSEQRAAKPAGRAAVIFIAREE
jgi:hypothetical protein